MIGGYEDDGGPSATNTAILHSILNFSKARLRRPRGKGALRNLRRQLGAETGTALPYIAPPIPVSPDDPPDTVTEVIDTPDLEPLPPPPSLADLKAVARAQAVLASNVRRCISKATRILDTDLTPPANKGTALLEELRALHPTRTLPVPAPPTSTEGPLTLDIETLRAAVKQLCSAASPGASGLTEEIIFAAIANDTVAAKLSRIIRDVAGGNTSACVRRRLLTCRLIAAGKPNGTARPVAVGEALLKIAALITLNHVSDHALAMFGHLQLGCLTENAVEIIAHEMQQDLDSDPTIGAMTLDATNAFNSMFRSSIAATLYSDKGFSILWSFFAYVYEEEGVLLLRIDGIEYQLTSSDGTRQGDVLGALLFCIGLHPHLVRLSKQFPSIKVKAFMDDINAWGPPSVLMDFYRAATVELAQCGLSLNNKSTVFLPHDFVLPDDLSDQLTVDYRGVKILGTMRSRDRAFVGAWLNNKVTKHDTLFRRLKLLPPNTATTLLREATLPRLNFLLRTHEPELTQTLAGTFDAQVTATLEHILNRTSSEWSDETVLLLQLPEREGGAGFTRTSHIRDCAFNGARDDVFRPVGGMDQAARSATLFNQWNAQIDAMGDCERGHRKATSLDHSGLWLHNRSTPFSEHAFRAALRFRVALPVRFLATSTVCPGCTTTYDRPRELQEHLPSCARLRRFNSATTHHSVNKAVQRLATRALIGQWNEPRYASYAPPDGDEDDGHLQGPDHTVYITAGGLTVDYKGIHIASKSHRRRSPAAVIAAKARASKALYERHVNAAGESFAVLAFFQTGWLDKGFVRLISDLVAANPSVLEFEEELMAIHVAIAAGVGRVLAHLE